MKRQLHVKVTPIYNTIMGMRYQLSPLTFRLFVSPHVRKRDLVEPGNIVSIVLRQHFCCFPKHLVGKLCFRVEIQELSNNQTYIKFLTL